MRVDDCWFSVLLEFCRIMSQLTILVMASLHTAVRREITKGDIDETY